MPDAGLGEADGPAAQPEPAMTVLDCLGTLAAAAGMAWAGYGLMDLIAAGYDHWRRA